jgi:hypothetical protein
VRQPVDRARIQAFARALGREASSDTKLYLTGGATAVLRGWRAATLAIDIRFEPEADEVLLAIARGGVCVASVASRFAGVEPNLGQAGRFKTIWMLPRCCHQASRVREC